jgi:lipopolysaccharide/colanic/teichoic acid biosynthesis glycosyltransferase
MTSQIEIFPSERLLSRRWNDGLAVRCKRAMDIGGAFALLVLLSPLLLMIAVLVRLTSEGPIFYRWKVVGKNGRHFTSYKFRTMVRDADRRKKDLLQFNEMTGPVFKMTSDPRITRVGRWLRRYSLDELPQLCSVLVGDMSLVGPRPPLQTEYPSFTDHQKLKLAVTPGMTCFWQISGRNSVSDLDEWVKLDLDYIRNWSLGLDFKILAKTAMTVVEGSGK